MADISPKVVFLNGTPGETLTARAHITPTPAYPFSILGLHQKFSNKAFRCKLIPPEKGQNTWQVAIEVTSQQPETLYEIITLKTDNTYKPELQVRAYAVYAKPVKKNDTQKDQ